MKENAKSVQETITKIVQSCRVRTLDDVQRKTIHVKDLPDETTIVYKTQTN